MINDNMDMMKGLKNIFDYVEYVDVCKASDIPFNGLNSYCVGIGALMVGRNKYPKLSWQEAYTNIMREMISQEGSHCKKELPSKVTMGKNFLKGTVAHAKSGFKNVDDKEYKRRISICNKCDELNNDRRCTECGCPIDKKAKRSSAVCGLNKW